MAEQDGKKPAAKALRVRPKPVIDEKQCIGCSMCLEHCPLGCLELRLPDDEDAIQEVAFLAQAEKCSGCGMCFKVCPADAVTMTLPDGTITDQRVTVTRRKKMAK